MMKIAVSTPRSALPRNKPRLRRSPANLSSFYPVLICGSGFSKRGAGTRDLHVLPKLSRREIPYTVSIRALPTLHTHPHVACASPFSHPFVLIREGMCAQRDISVISVISRSSHVAPRFHSAMDHVHCNFERP